VTIEAGRKRVIRSLRRNWSEGDFDQRLPRRIHYVGGVRKESAADCGQCQRDELFGTGLCPSGWSTVAGPVPLCPLWPEAPSVVRRQQDLLSALCLPRGV
jgi:hypothetical protein